MNSLEIIRSIKAKAAADQAAAQALDDLLCAKRDALMAPFVSALEELGHLVKTQPAQGRTSETLATSMRISPSIHNHHARFEIRDSYSHVVTAGVEGKDFIVRFHTWHKDNMDRNTTRDASAQQALDHLLQYIADNYEEPATP